MNKEEPHMRSMFPGYYPPSEEELGSLWDYGLVVVDTNALLNLFRYTASTRSTFLRILSEKAERIWLPHQVGLEFHKNRLDVIKDQQSAFKKLAEKTASARNSINQELNARRHHPSLDPEGLKKIVDEAMASIDTEIEAKKNAYRKSVETEDQHDETTRQITALYEGRVGKPYSEERLQEIYEEGEKRYDGKQPPGFKDANKPVPDRYGDLVLWHQILDEADKRKLPTLFVTDDGKEDWWRTLDGKTIGPRVELIEEFHARVGQRVHFYSPQEFMQYASLKDARITPETMVEVREVSDAWADTTEQSKPQYPKEFFEQRKNKKILDSLAAEYSENQDAIDFAEIRLRSYYDRLVRYNPNDIENAWGGEDTTVQTLQHEISKLRERLDILYQHQKTLTATISSMHDTDDHMHGDMDGRWRSMDRSTQARQGRQPLTVGEREELRARDQQAALRAARLRRNERVHRRPGPIGEE